MKRLKQTVSKRNGQARLRRHLMGAVAAILCLTTTPALAQKVWTAAELLKPEHTGFVFRPIPLAHSTNDGGLSFDLGDSAHPKLQLRLAEPLLIGPNPWASPLDLAGAGFIASSSLGWLTSDQLSVEVNATQAGYGSPFRPLGSIHCENGVLAPDSYTASECYFVDRAPASELNSISLGARYRMGDRTSAAISLFRQEAGSTNSVAAQNFALPLTGLAISPAMHSLVGQPPEFLHSEVSGIELEFQVGVSTDRAGELQLGLQLTRVLDASQEASFGAGTGFRHWVLDGASDSARVSLDWQKGAFSGGVQSFYRAPVEFMNRRDLGSLTTFDVHFTWRTPWNANLSVGASNLLNSGSEDSSSPDSALADPFESVYGRIPYVRYQQDL